MATTGTLFGYSASANGDGTYTVGGYWGTYTLTDLSDEPGDNPAILGDVGTDTLQVDQTGSSVTYQAALANGFIVNNGGGLYLYSYSTYADGDIVTGDPNATFTIQCFTTGARIETPCGAVAIEALAVGDTVTSASGSEREIVWIGRRTVDCSGKDQHMAPVRVMANAFGAGVPERDMFLSPGHPVLVRQNDVEVLVPIMNLINGTTIERTAMPSVTYWHIELDQHDILLADGLPAESFFDMGSRGWFDNDLDDVLANPDLVPAGRHGRCREVAVEGPLVEAERRRLAELFYADLCAQCAWPTAEQSAAV
ncbi:Hint domain-containing protein [Aurantimonas sp. 22II-16-19i]|uniref:Hint domain-containing protein n=1 Tax=Aurantimonas sp. 22II-16-19i TaxID=1317114 RepID=UPI0009F7DB9C|nr:Hint domain-containing protein [Aurantimonas sp. 22II-16-19i]ORE96833.1 hypothetical protein ATO4_11484 [Aurantimonas sp. 22II-16-19i]